ncbi:MAG: hypothetical protein GYB37_09710 [Algicola sp.]|nr:hypothetical protein [Algicola sp.]
MKHLFFVCAVLLFFSCSKSEENTVAKPESPITENPEKENPEQPKQPDNQPDPTLVIESVSPQIVDLGDTLSLKGENFNKDVRLSIGQSQLKILFNNDSIIEFELPYWGFEPDSLHISVDNRDTIAYYRNAFQLYQPEIDSIPSNFGYRDTVVVYGKHLTNRPDINDGIVELNNDRLTVIDHSKDSIRFVLPYNVDKHENDLLVRAQLRTLRKDKGVVIPDPTITGISKDSLLINENITIYGSNFFEFRDYLHEVYIGENRAEIEQVYADSIITKVPLGLYTDRNINKVTVKVVEKEITQDLGLYLKNTWYQYGRIDNKGLTDGRYDWGNITGWGFGYDDSFYTLQFRGSGGFYGNPNKIGFVKYNVASNTWETMPDINIDFNPDRISSFYTFSLNDGNVYIYNARLTDNFYKYSLESGELTSLQDFQNTDPIDRPIGFKIGNSFYLGMGYSKPGSKTIPNRKIWSYDEASDSWSYQSEMPFVEGQGDDNHSNYFLKNGKAYIGNGLRVYDLWEYTPNDLWIRKTDLVNPVQAAVFTQIDNKGFYHQRHSLGHTGGVFHEYDIELDKYSIREDLTIFGYLLENRAMFVHDDYVYFIGYTSSPNLPKYSSIRRYDHVVLRTELSNFTN